ncbi:hypothetical protein L1049_010233 [Liquidambar formosana]|uniref:LisH domain-containing protein n=1 Tax=Liquidambar formosana TaxID=63359 RepID=A0AAP0N767_LIQFO
MASGDEWDAQKMLELYLHDYMVKKNMHKTAEIFKQEAKVCNDPIVIDSPDGFLSEWWSFFYDTYASRQPKQLEVKEEASVEPAQMMETEVQNVGHLEPKLEMIQQTPGQFPMGTDFDKMLGQPAACLLAAKVYEEGEHLRRPARQLAPDLRLNDVNKMALSKSDATSSRYSNMCLNCVRNWGHKNC